jgi:hypothetical protein
LIGIHGSAFLKELKIGEALRRCRKQMKLNACYNGILQGFRERL